MNRPIRAIEAAWGPFARDLDDAERRARLLAGPALPTSAGSLPWPVPQPEEPVVPSANTARRPAPHAEPSTPDQLAASILLLLAAIERHPPGAPAALAFRSALARKGREIAAAGGPAALSDIRARIHAADLGRADAREAVIATAWAGLAHVQDGT